MGGNIKLIKENQQKLKLERLNIVRKKVIHSTI